MLKPFSLIFFILVMVWAGSILVTSDAHKRIDRTCIPVEYADIGATSAMTLVDQGWGDSTHRFFTRMHYGCRYVIWSMFYEREWKDYQNTQRQQAQPAQAVAPASAASAASKPATAASAAAPRKLANH